MERYNLEWQGRKYPAIDIKIFIGTDDEMTATVSSSTLNDVLMAQMESSDEELSHKAYHFDEQITYFMDEANFELSENEIRQIVEKSYE